MGRLKRIARRLASAAGYEVQRKHPKWHPSYKLWRALDHFGVDLVIDVGANEGQSSAELRALGYQGAIVSFEPLEDAHRVLVGAAAQDSRWHVHTRCAIGDHDGEAFINVSANSVSSSLRPMLEAHRAAAVNSSYVRVEHVPVCRLDRVVVQYLANTRRPFLKVDTQGFEQQVLDGAAETLRRVCGVHCELSLVPLYEGQTLWDDIRAQLEQAGFTLWSLHPGFTDAHTGRTLQIDGTFFRSDLAAGSKS